jgi:hypothetical protein
LTESQAYLFIRVFRKAGNYKGGIRPFFGEENIEMCGAYAAVFGFERPKERSGQGNEKKEQEKTG